MTGNSPKLEMIRPRLSLTGARGRCPVTISVQENPAECFQPGASLLFFKKIWPHCSRQDLSFPTRDQTCASCVGSRVLATGLPGKSHPVLLNSSPVSAIFGEAGLRSPNTPCLSGLCVVVFHFCVCLSRSLSTGAQVFLVHFPRTW